VIRKKILYVHKDIHLTYNMLLHSVVKVENQRWGNCTSALGPITVGCGPVNVFMKIEVWECWISIMRGAGTAFLCIQWHFNYWLHYIAKVENPNMLQNFHAETW